MKKMTKCPCCDSEKIREIHTGLYDKNHFIEGDFSLMKCDNCKLEFTNPLLNEKQLEKYYPEEDYYSFKERIKIALLYHKLSAYYYSGRNPILNIFLWPVSSLLYTYHIDKNSRGKKLLEIGCGDGLQLEVYKKYELETYGLEPYGKELTDREGKLGISRQTIKKAKYEKNSFDYIILKEVLEHIPNQKQVIEKCYKWLKPNGRLILVIPNTKSLWKNLFGRNWYGYDIPRHICNYNKENISFFLKKHKFKINKIKIYDLPYMIDGSIKFKLADKGKKNKFLDSGLSKLLFTPISLIVSYLKLGSLMEIEAEK